MFNPAEYILENNYTKKVMFLTMMFGLMMIMTQCTSSSQDSTTAPEKKVTATETDAKAITAETKTEKESSKESSDSTNTKTDLKALTKKYIPKGAEIIHKIVQGKFAPAGVKSNADNVIVMYRAKDSSPTDPYEIVVLRPSENTWDNYTLPQPDTIWSIMKPLAVFFENADKDTEKELFILEEAESGAGPTGAVPFYRTRVYDWTGSEFKHLEDISDKISADADTADKVRKELKRIVR